LFRKGWPEKVGLSILTNGKRVLSMRLLRLSLLVLSVSLLLFAVGCGGKNTTIPVTGTLLWDDGKPVVGASISFVPVGGGKQRSANGGTGKDGAFELTTFRPGDGAFPGEYTVIVLTGSAPEEVPPSMVGLSTEEMTKKMAEYQNKPKKKVDGDAVPVIYTKPETSPLRYTIESSTSKIELKIKRT
jgi:hypothetical protein